jgi:hypothetical protein
MSFEKAFEKAFENATCRRFAAHITSGAGSQRRVEGSVRDSDARRCGHHPTDMLIVSIHGRRCDNRSRRDIQFESALSVVGARR